MVNFYEIVSSTGFPMTMTGSESSYRQLLFRPEDFKRQRNRFEKRDHASLDKFLNFKRERDCLSQHKKARQVLMTK